MKRSRVSLSVGFLYFFALFIEEGLLVSPCLLLYTSTTSEKILSTIYNNTLEEENGNPLQFSCWSFTHAVSSCDKWGLLLSCGSRAQLSHSMWDLSGPGIEPVSLVLQGGFLTTRSLTTHWAVSLKPVPLLRPHSPMCSLTVIFHSSLFSPSLSLFSSSH